MRSAAYRISSHVAFTVQRSPAGASAMTSTRQSFCCSSRRRPRCHLRQTPTRTAPCPGSTGVIARVTARRPEPRIAHFLLGVSAACQGQDCTNLHRPDRTKQSELLCWETVRKVWSQAASAKQASCQRSAIPPSRRRSSQDHARSFIALPAGHPQATPKRRRRAATCRPRTENKQARRAVFGQIGIIRPQKLDPEWLGTQD
jgi:hypothetical protein